jgi:hypothetical protein
MKNNKNKKNRNKKNKNKNKTDKQNNTEIKNNLDDKYAQFKKCILHGQYEEFIHSNYKNDVINAINFQEYILGNVIKTYSRNNDIHVAISYILNILKTSIDFQEKWNICNINEPTYTCVADIVKDNNIVDNGIDNNKTNAEIKKISLDDKHQKNIKLKKYRLIVNDYENFSKNMTVSTFTFDAFKNTSVISTKYTEKFSKFNDSNKNPTLNKKNPKILFVPSGWTGHLVGILIIGVDGNNTDYDIYIVDSLGVSGVGKVIACAKFKELSSIKNLYHVLALCETFITDSSSFYNLLNKFFIFEEYKSKINTDRTQIKATCTYYCLYYITKLLLEITLKYTGDVEIYDVINTWDTTISSISKHLITIHNRDCKSEEELLFTESINDDKSFRKKFIQYVQKYKKNIINNINDINVNVSHNNLFENDTLIYDDKVIMDERIVMLLNFVDKTQYEHDPKYNILITLYIEKLFVDFKKQHLTDKNMKNLFVINNTFNDYNMDHCLHINMLLLKCIEESTINSEINNYLIGEFYYYDTLCYLFNNNIYKYDEHKSKLLYKYYNLLFMYSDKITTINYNIYNKFIDDKNIKFSDNTNIDNKIKHWMGYMFGNYSSEDIKCIYDDNHEYIFSYIENIHEKKTHIHSLYPYESNNDHIYKNNNIIEILKHLVNNNVNALNKYIDLYFFYNIKQKKDYIFGNICPFIFSKSMAMYVDVSTINKDIDISENYNTLNMTKTNITKALLNLYFVNKNNIRSLNYNEIINNFNVLNDFVKLFIFFVIVYHDCYNDIHSNIKTTYETYLQNTDKIDENYKSVANIMYIIKNVLDKKNCDIYKLNIYVATCGLNKKYTPVFIKEFGELKPDFVNMIVNFNLDTYYLLMSCMKYEDVLNLFDLNYPKTSEMISKYERAFDETMRYITISNNNKNITINNNIFTYENIIVSGTKNTDKYEHINNFIKNEFIFKDDNDLYIGCPVNTYVNFKLYFNKSLYINYDNNNYKMKYNDYFINENITFISDDNSVKIIYLLKYIYENKLVMLYQKNNKIYLNGDNTKEIVNRELYTYNIWIHNIPYSFLLYNSNTHRYSIFIMENITKNKFTSAYSEGEIIKRDVGNCYIIDISYNGLYLQFSKENTKDLECYMELCILYKKIICMKKIFNIFIQNVDKQSLVYNLYIQNNCYNNLFGHYFQYIKNEYDYLNGNTKKIFSITKFLETNKYPKMFNLHREYKQEILKYTPFNNTTNKNVDDDVITYQQNLQKMFYIIKDSNNREDDDICNELKTYMDINNKIHNCDTSAINENVYIENIKKIKQKINNTEKEIESKITDLYGNSDIIKQYILYYKLLVYRLIYDIMLDLINMKNITCAEKTKIYDRINTDLLYDGDRYDCFVLFEILNGYFIRKEQYNIIDNIIQSINNSSNINNTYNLYQLLMGKGKTSTITPLIMLYYVYYASNNDNINNVILLMPKRLIYQSLSGISDNMYILQYDYHLNIANMNNYDVLVNERNSERIHIHNLLVKYDNEYTNNIPKVMLIDDETMKNIYLKVYENNEADVGSFIKKSVIITDEFDSMYYPLNSDLLIPLESKKLKETTHFSTDIITFLVNKIFKIVNNNEKCESLVELHNIIFDTKSENVLYDEYYNMYKSHKIALKNYNLVHILFKCMKMEYNKDYGLPQRKSHSHNIYAVPYSFVNTPIINSEFSNIDIKVILTIFCYAYLGKITIDILNVCINYLKQYVKNVEIISTEIAKKKINDILGPFNMTYNSVINYDKTYDEQYVIDLNKNSDNQKIEKLNMYMLEKIIIPNMTVEYNFAKCSFVNIIDSDFSSKKCGFSGTLAMNLPLYNIQLLENGYNKKHDTGDEILRFKYYDEGLGDVTNKYTNIIYNNVDNEEITAAIYGCIGTNKKIYKFKNNEQNENEKINQILSVIENYDALIDCGAFLKNFKNIEVATQICKIKNKCIFIDTDDNGNDITYIMKNNTVNKYNAKSKMEQPIFIYYDNKHTVGVDIKQASLFNGLCTVNYFNNLTQISQGIYRLRNLNYGHSVDFIVTEHIYEKITNENNDILTQRLMLYRYLRNMENNNILNNTNKLLEQTYLLSERKRKNGEKIKILNYIYYNEIDKLNPTGDIAGSDIAGSDMSLYYNEKIYQSFIQTEYTSISNLYKTIYEDILKLVENNHNKNITSKDHINGLIKNYNLFNHKLPKDDYEKYTQLIIKKMINNVNLDMLNLNISTNINKNVNIEVDVNVNVNVNLNVNVILKKSIAQSYKAQCTTQITLGNYIKVFENTVNIYEIITKMDNKTSPAHIYKSKLFDSVMHTGFFNYKKEMDVLDIIDICNQYYYMDDELILIISYYEYLILSNLLNSGKYEYLKDRLFDKSYVHDGDITSRGRHLHIQMLLGKKTNLLEFLYILYYMKKCNRLYIKYGEGDIYNSWEFLSESIYKLMFDYDHKLLSDNHTDIINKVNKNSRQEIQKYNGEPLINFIKYLLDPFIQENKSDYFDNIPKDSFEVDKNINEILDFLFNIKLKI